MTRNGRENKRRTAMAIYLCSKCDEWKDADYDPPSDVVSEHGGGLVCEGCMEELANRFNVGFEAFFKDNYTESDDE